MLIASDTETEQWGLRLPRGREIYFPENRQSKIKVLGQQMPNGHQETILPASVFMAPPSLSVAAAAKSLQLCLTLWDPMDGSPPGASVPGILQARILEWVAISFSLHPYLLCS